MILRFPYVSEPLTGPAPPSLAPGSLFRYRPFAPVTLFGASGQWNFTQAVLDPGSDDIVFPMSTVHWIGTPLLPDSGRRVRWRGTLHPLRFAAIELELDDGTGFCRWPTVAAFSPAPLKYPLLGLAGCLEYFDSTFRGANQLVELTPNPRFPGITS